MAAPSHNGHAENHGHGSFKSYTIGFILSIVLTVIPLVVVLNDLLDGVAALAVLLGTAVLQFLVQLLLFMHLRDEEKPRYNLMTLLTGLVMVVMVVGGSIWIMTYNGVAH